MIAFGAAMAVGTFVESSYNTQTARLLVYNSLWFEIIIGLLALNFLGNIRKYKLYRKTKWTVLILHLAFIFIIVGAYISRYYGYEGIMPIAEGQQTNKMYSDKVYLTVSVEKRENIEIKKRTLEKPLTLSPMVDNSFTMKTNFQDEEIELVFEDYIMNAEQQFIYDSTGSKFLKIVENSQGTRREHFIKEGTALPIGDHTFSYDKNTLGAITIVSDSIITPNDGTVFKMALGETNDIKAYEKSPIEIKALYTIGDLQFVIPELPLIGELNIVSNNNYKDQQTPDRLVLRLKTSEGDRLITIDEDISGSESKKIVYWDGFKYSFHFGRKPIELPFKIKLNDFIAEKHPGTEQSFVSFESQVSVQSEEANFDARIYMNHVLDYKGYRFFQASYYPDESGTILSVNHDHWGTYTTYLGYFLLYLGLIAILFDRNSRFGMVRKALKQLRANKVLLVLIFLVSTAANAQSDKEVKTDSLIQALKVDKNHSRKFGHLIIQDNAGRMKPLNTFASELLRKLAKADVYKGLEPDQVLLSMIQFPKIWYDVPIIKLKRGNDAIRVRLGIDKKATYAALSDFYDDIGGYKLAGQIDDAYRAPVPNQFQKDLIEADRKASLLYYVLSGDALKIFPVPKHENNKWISATEVSNYQISGRDSAFVAAGLTLYLAAIYQSIKENDYTGADRYLGHLEVFQKKYGRDIMPSANKVKAEILYHRYDIFKKLFVWYLLAGLFLLCTEIINVLKQNKYVTSITRYLHWAIIVLFVGHSLGLIIRAYVAGHAPWSDAYETMIYVAWSTMFFGLIFGNKSKLTIAATSFVAAMILMVAHWNWLDPAITNLQPVLDSYWLMIHVAIIVASYGPFTLGMILGLVNLNLMIAINKNNKQRLTKITREINYIIELTLTIGLVMLAVGNFLGAQWANESWGRYWAWDPKETWALISIIIYAFVIHMRLVPALRGEWAMSFMAVIAYSSILMTYFGVNFYLEGLHSYASGDKMITSNFIVYAVVFVAIVAFLSHRNNRNVKLMI